LGKLVAVIGNGGSGKTTLTKLLCQRLGYTPFLEQHAERPFQAAFQADLQRLSFPNQVDYLLYRAEQEWTILSQDEVGVQDGGLDQDFHIFTRLFLQNQYLSADEFNLCRRLYNLARKTLPGPACMIKLNVPLELLVERRRQRDREIDIAANADLPRIEALFEDWFCQARPACPVMEVESNAGDIRFVRSIDAIVEFVKDKVD
jgi:deoxyadenosine/deoxycytidine kinase